jgi:hypothetical protein
VSWWIKGIEEVEEIAQLENIKALVASIRQRRDVIQTHTLQYDPYDLTKSFNAIYDEAKAMGEELDTIHELLILFWAEIVSATIGRKIDLGLTDEQAREMEKRVIEKLKERK